MFSFDDTVILTIDYYIGYSISFEYVYFRIDRRSYFLVTSAAAYFIIINYSTVSPLSSRPWSRKVINESWDILNNNIIIAFTSGDLHWMDGCGVESRGAFCEDDHIVRAFIFNVHAVG